jgi:hypothetical protein
VREVPIDPALEAELRLRAYDRANLMLRMQQEPVVMAAKFEELLFGLRRLAFDPDVGNVHHARNVARVMLGSAGEWGDAEDRRWNDTWMRNKDQPGQSP